MHAVTNIQKYSIHDGDGIRTTVFFKGCHLKCQWCHNPETQKFETELQVDTARCTGCGRCAAVCPQGAITISAEGKAVTDRSKCIVCGKCENACLGNYRTVVGREYSVKELVKICLQDQMFYEESHGGVTLSGGEVMAMDPEYIQALVKALYREGIDVAIDTCGQAPYSSYKAILPYVHTWLYDIKVMDDEELANMAICLCHQVDRALESYIQKKDREFTTEGGIRERMTAARLEQRASQKQIIESQQKEITSLQREIDVLRNEIGILRSEINVLRSQNEMLKHENETLKHENI